MDYTIEASFYDGQSSASRKTTVAFNDNMNEFCFNTTDGILMVWKLEDLQFEKYESLLEIRNKNYSGALLKIEDAAFGEKFYGEMKKNKRIDIHSSLLNLGLTKITTIAVCLLGLIVVAYLYLLPPIAEKSAELLPESFDDEIGNTFINAFLNSNDIDTTRTKYLEQFVAELDLQNRKKLRVTVVQSNDVNAFALPNGQIVVYSAILNNMKSADELVALLGHEASHINNRHSIKMLCRNLAGYMLVSLLFSDVNGVMAVLADNAQQLHSLSYSRAFEEEADEHGLKILMNNKINPNGMIKLFEQLEKESTNTLPEIMSTHPLTTERKKKMNEIISKSEYEVRPNEKLQLIFKQIKN